MSSKGVPVCDVILRHPRERRGKCSLQPLVGRPDIHFHNARPGFTFDASGYVMLDVAGEEIQASDIGRPILLLDSTWRLLPQLMRCVTGNPLRRRLPENVSTAYPRRSKISDDPKTGLASVEALYLARRLLSRADETLLDHYRWREQFLQQFDVTSTNDSTAGEENAL